MTYTSMNEKHYFAQSILIDLLRASGFDGHIIRRVGGWPGTAWGSLEFFDVPYAFKVCALQEARHLGYESCLWLDVCVVPKTDLQEVFDHIDKYGLFAYSNSEYSMEGHVSAFTAEAMGVSLESFLTETAITAIAFGMNFNHAVGKALMDDWYQMLATNRLAFLSFIPEQAVLTFLINQQQLLPFTCSLTDTSPIQWAHALVE